MNTSDSERRRLSALREYQIMDTLEEQDFEEITAIAAEICGTPISLITLVDDQRQWFKSHLGLSTRETPREQAFCAHAINRPSELMIVNNPTEDARFHNNPLVTGNPHIRFYAGAPLVNSEGHALGTLCVIDQKPHTLTDRQQQTLRALANQAMAQIELRRKVKELKEANEDLSEYAHIASHDLKSPINTLDSLIRLFSDSYSDQLDEEGLKLIGMMSDRVNHLRKLTEGILNYSIPERAEAQRTWIDLGAVLRQVAEAVRADERVNIQLQASYPQLLIDETHARQIFQNLLSNAIKYNDSKEIIVSVTDQAGDDSYWDFAVTDNGRGIEEQYLSHIFKPFETLRTADRYGEAGTGIGLATVRKLVERNGGTVQITSTVGQGSQFLIRLPRELVKNK